MLAELRRQGEIRDRYPEVRKTFEDFVKAGEFHREKSLLGEKFWWEREVKLSHLGENFHFSVATEGTSFTLPDAKLRIDVSTDDGRQITEYLPSIKEMLELGPEIPRDILANLSDLEVVVRKFNNSRSRIRQL